VIGVSLAWIRWRVGTIFTTTHVVVGTITIYNHITIHHKHGAIHWHAQTEDMNAVCILIILTPLNCSLVVFYMHDALDAKNFCNLYLL
jgi:hypothetical protein